MCHIFTFHSFSVRTGQVDLGEGSSISISNIYKNFLKKKENIVIGSPHNIEHPPGIRNKKPSNLWDNENTTNIN